MTARALAREVRAVDARSLEAGVETDEDGVDEAPRETVWLRVTPRVRARWSRARLLACRVAGETLSQAAVAEQVAAEVVSAFGLDVDPGFTPSSARVAKPSTLPEHGPVHEARASVREGPPASPLALPAFLAPLVENLESADAFELDARLRRALRIEQRLLAEMGPLLLELARCRGYREYQCSSLAAFARELLGMSPRKAQALLRLERASGICPALGEAYRIGRLSWGARWLALHRAGLFLLAESPQPSHPVPLGVRPGRRLESDHALRGAPSARRARGDRTHPRPCDLYYELGLRREGALVAYAPGEKRIQPAL
jgi:hypothetical protein